MTKDPQKLKRATIFKTEVCGFGIQIIPGPVPGSGSGQEKVMDLDPFVMRGWNRIRSLSDRIRNTHTHIRIHKRSHSLTINTHTNTQIHTHTHTHTHMIMQVASRQRCKNWDYWLLSFSIIFACNLLVNMSELRNFVIFTWRQQGMFALHNSYFLVIGVENRNYTVSSAYIIHLMNWK